jgi:quercetin dioxygenase-like cupin family protein
MPTIIVTEGMYGVLDIFGATVEFMTPSEDTSGDYCVLMGTLPAGGYVPLHSHPDDESFYLVSGAVQVLSERDRGFEWLDVRPQGFIHIPGGAKHGFRNKSTEEPVVQLITTTRRLGRFFQEIGRPVAPGTFAPPPTSEELERFMQLAAKYGHWMGSPAENAAVGLQAF